MSRRIDGGFTLLEIIVALAIAAVGIAAVAKYTASATVVSYETEQRMLAVWAAGNRLSELRITRAWPAPGGSDQQVDMGGRTWYLTETISETGQPDIRRVDVQVYTDPQRGEREFSIHGYLARNVPPEQAVPEDPEDPGGSGDPGEMEDGGEAEAPPEESGGIGLPESSDEAAEPPEDGQQSGQGADQ